MQVPRFAEPGHRPRVAGPWLRRDDVIGGARHLELADEEGDQPADDVASDCRQKHLHYQWPMFLLGRLRA
jgi:hypothetical protein